MTANWEKIYSVYVYVMHICYLPGGRYVASDRTQDLGHSFSHKDRPSPVNNMFIFFCLIEDERRQIV